LQLPATHFWLVQVDELISSSDASFTALLFVCLALHSAAAAAEASRQLKVPMPFLTTIVVPIVGNAAEHASALIFAVKNRMEISLGVAIGELCYGCVNKYVTDVTYGTSRP
jgi:calcium/proton exchanger cax